MNLTSFGVLVRRIVLTKLFRNTDLPLCVDPDINIFFKSFRSLICISLLLSLPKITGREYLSLSNTFKQSLREIYLFSSCILYV